jgi:hypothetical protein
MTQQAITPPRAEVAHLPMARAEFRHCALLLPHFPGCRYLQVSHPDNAILEGRTSPVMLWERTLDAALRHAVTLGQAMDPRAAGPDGAEMTILVARQDRIL